MWYVIKYNNNQKSIFLNSLKEKIKSDFKIYITKIKILKHMGKNFKKVEKNILENYLICKSKEFDDLKFVSSLKYTKGLGYFLLESKYNQKEIENFVSNCKSYENEEGYISPEFFSENNLKRGKFISGILFNRTFKFISVNGSKMRVLIDGINLTINNKRSNHFCRL